MLKSSLCDLCCRLVHGIWLSLYSGLAEKNVLMSSDSRRRLLFLDEDHACQKVKTNPWSYSEFSWEGRLHCIICYELLQCQGQLVSKPRKILQWMYFLDLGNDT